MRIRVTIDHEFDLPDSIADTAKDYSSQTGDPVEVVLEENRSLWWGHLQDSALDLLQVEVVD